MFIPPKQVLVDNTQDAALGYLERKPVENPAKAILKRGNSLPPRTAGKQKPDNANAEQDASLDYEVARLAKLEKRITTSYNSDISLPKYHWARDKPDTRDYRYVATAVTSYAAKVDLRQHCTAIEDQGNLGSCTGNAIAAEGGTKSVVK
jgi:hypothetical protein